jgi:hypothetical protein
VVSRFIDANTRNHPTIRVNTPIQKGWHKKHTNNLQRKLLQWQTRIPNLVAFAAAGKYLGGRPMNDHDRIIEFVCLLASSHVIGGGLPLTKQLKTSSKFPHGDLSLSLGVLVSVAWVLSATVQLACDFVHADKVTTEYGTTLDNPDIMTEREEFALNTFCHEEHFEYRENSWGSRDVGLDDFDDLWTLARALASMTTLLGFFAVVFSWLLTCVARSRLWLLLHAIGFMTCAILQICTLCVLGSSLCKTGLSGDSCELEGDPDDYPMYQRTTCVEDCTLGMGGGMALSAFLLWFASAVVMIFIIRGLIDQEEEGQEASLGEHSETHAEEEEESLLMSTGTSEETDKSKPKKKVSKSHKKKKAEVEDGEAATSAAEV